MSEQDLSRQLAQLIRGHCSDPFALLGCHHDDHGAMVVRGFAPTAKTLSIVDPQGTVLAPMQRLHPEGVFVGELPGPAPYRLRAEYHDGHQRDYEDPYRFGSPLSPLDLHLIGEGTHEYLYDKLGANRMTIDGVEGVHFALWAPNAARVSVVGMFNNWDGRVHAMRKHLEAGIWDIFLPGVGQGELYKFELLDAHGQLLPLKSDPLARYCEPAPGNAARVFHSEYDWQDDNWMASRSTRSALNEPISIYEVHLGSWKRHADDHRPYSYAELADNLIDYVVDMGFTHIELMPIHEHPFDGSWGYQPIGLYAPTCRFGDPDACRALIDRAHQRELGVIVDWVAAHFPRDEHGLVRFDGTSLYEHEDPKRGAHVDWGTLIFNLSRREVSNYLVANALYWIREFHVDALRVDAVASMLYLDYSREDGEWVANEHGSNENLEAIQFFAELNDRVHAAGGVTMAEESTAWPMVSRPTYSGGLGFSYKWNLGWMHDTLNYLAEDPIARKHHHDKMTFGLIYAFSENFILPLSHDEVVHGKRSLVERIGGSMAIKLATLRAYYAFMYAHPGKKLLFMGAEIAQRREWQFDGELDWGILNDAGHRGVQRAVRALNERYRSEPALYRLDVEAQGFAWLMAENRDMSIFAFARRGGQRELIVCISNFTPVMRAGLRLGVPHDGAYGEIFNSASTEFEGSDSTPPRLLESQPVGHDGQPFSVVMDLPALATIYFKITINT